jgi:nucleotide-binding universal stress UspA family protein
MLGGTASKAAHETQLPLLIARRPPNGFPGHIQLASDGSPGSWAPAHAAAGLAASFDSSLEVVHVVDGTHPERHRVVEAQVAELGEATGSDPVLIEPAGHATHEIVEAAQARRSALIVCGRRGLHGIRALGSVSERLVHRAPCSVLLIPAGEDASS